MKKFIVLLLLVSLGLLGGAPYGFSAIQQTNLSGLEVDCNSDPAGAVTDACVEVTDRAGTNTVTVDGAGDTAFLETGGNTSDPDLAIAGFTQHTDSVEIVSENVNERLKIVDAAISSQYTILNSQYIQLYAIQASARPASGVGVGSIVVIANANNTGDCGTAGGGSSYAVCFSSGASWRNLS